MKLSVSMLTGVLVTVITLVMIFQAIGDTADDVKSAAQNASTSNRSSGTEHVSSSAVYPLSGFFAPNGLLLLAFIAGIILAIIGAVMAFRR